MSIPGKTGAMEERRARKIKIWKQPLAINRKDIHQNEKRGRCHNYLKYSTVRLLAPKISTEQNPKLKIIIVLLLGIFLNVID